MDATQCPLQMSTCRATVEESGKGPRYRCDYCKVVVSTDLAGVDAPRSGKCKGQVRPALADLLQADGYRKGGRILNFGANARPFGKKGSQWQVEEATVPLIETPGEDVYDAIIVDNYLSRCTDPRGALVAAGRLMKPMGALILVDRDSGSLAANLFGPAWGPRRKGLRFLFSREGWEDLLRQEGFVLVDVAMGIGSPLARHVPGPVVRLPLPDSRGELAIIARWARE